MNDIFDILFLLARPAAGKSEIIHYLQNLDEKERSSRFHIGKMHVIDDFPMLWTWFEEDDLLKRWDIHGSILMLKAIFFTTIFGIF